MIDDLIGVPFQDRGRTMAGADCWGIVVLGFRRIFGIALPLFADDYPDIADRTRQQLSTLIQSQIFAWDDVPAGSERSGDVVLLAVGGEPCHVGLVIEPGRMLTTARGDASRIESYRSLKWRNRVDGIYRHRGTHF